MWASIRAMWTGVNTKWSGIRYKVRLHAIEHLAKL